MVALPFVGGKMLARYSLFNKRDDEIKEDIKKKRATLASILYSIGYENSNYPREVALLRSIEVAWLYVKNGCDIYRCEYNGKSPAKSLYDKSYFKIPEIQNFFLEFK